MKTTIDYARQALDALPAAISGQGGHPGTFHAACTLVRLGLGDGDALALLHEFNRRCSPPWTEKELRHKLADARRGAGGQARRCRLPAAAPAVRMVWHTAPRPLPRPAKAEAVTAKPAPEPPRPLPIMPDFADLDPAAPHLAGWTRNGTPIYRGTQAEWRETFRKEKHG